MKKLHARIAMAALAALMLAPAAGCAQPKGDEAQISTDAAVSTSISAQRMMAYLQKDPDPVDTSLIEAGTIITPEQMKGVTIDDAFSVDPISDELFERIDGVSYKHSGAVDVDDLSYIRILHKDIDGNVKVGEMIANSRIADDLLEIFRKLYEIDYPIERMTLVDNYDASDDASMEDNNTSCFNDRRIAGSSTISNHARGLAVDINPLYNPYVIPSSGYVSPSSGAPYARRSNDFDYKIDRDDACYRLFKEHGFTWGGDWSSPKDYQHFEKTF